jgi:hypothetical protein
MRWSIIGVVALACVAGGCHARRSIYMDPGKPAQSEQPAQDSQAAKPDKPATTARATEPHARPGT